MMRWKHYDAARSGVCLINHKGAGEATGYRYGIVSTGRTRVFAGYFVEVELLGESIIGESGRSMREALRAVAAKLAELDTSLDCAGLCDQWSESGLTENSGWGYLPWAGSAVNMMAPHWADCVHGMFPDCHKDSMTPQA